MRLSQVGSIFNSWPGKAQLFWHSLEDNFEKDRRGVRVCVCACVSTMQQHQAEKGKINVIFNQSASASSKQQSNIQEETPDALKDIFTVCVSMHACGLCDIEPAAQQPGVLQGGGVRDGGMDVEVLQQSNLQYLRAHTHISM